VLDRWEERRRRTGSERIRIDGEQDERKKKQVLKAVKAVVVVETDKGRFSDPDAKLF